MHYFRILLLLVLCSCTAKFKTPVIEFEKSIKKVTIYAEWEKVPVALFFYFHKDEKTVKYIVWQMSSSPYLNKVDFDVKGKWYELIPGNDRYILNTRTYDMNLLYEHLIGAETKKHF